MANRTKNVKQKTRDWVDATDASDDFNNLPEYEKIRYSRKRRKGEFNGRRSYSTRH